MGLGLGVRANGLKGICPTDFLLEGECKVLVLTAANLCLCFRPWSELGLVWLVTGVTGEHGAESEAGLDESEWLGSGVDVECLRLIGLAGLKLFKLCEVIMSLLSFTHRDFATERF